MVRRLPRESTLSPMYHAFAAYQRVGSLLAEALSGAPLDAEGYARYSAIRELQPVTPTELARRLGMATTTVLDAVHSMIAAGHAVRLRNPKDGRSYLLRLTDAGEQVHEETHALFALADERLQGYLGDQRATVTEALVALKAAAEAAQEEMHRVRVEEAG